MGEKELFEEVLNKFKDKYNFEIKHPYDDSYFEIYKNDRNIGGMNPSGYNLLRNLKELCSLLEAELL